MRNRAIGFGLLCLLAAGPGGAQPVADSVSQGRGGWLFGASFGVPGYRTEAEPQLFTIGFQWTQLSPNRLGADFSVGTMPRLLAEGIAVLGLRVGVAAPLTLAPGVLLLPSAGVSAIGGMSGADGGGAAGLNAGVAAVMRGTGPIGLRTGITWHRFQDSDGALWLFEIGFARIPSRWRQL